MKTIQLKNSLEEIYKNINNSQQPNQQVKLLAVTNNHPNGDKREGAMSFFLTFYVSWRMVASEYEDVETF